jgi:hypothetical protein
MKTNAIDLTAVTQAREALASAESRLLAMRERLSAMPKSRPMPGKPSNRALNSPGGKRLLRVLARSRPSRR